MNIFDLAMMKALSGGKNPEIPDLETPTNSKYLMRDTDGNLAAVSPVDPRYPNLVFTYTHTGNKEVYVTDLDVSTGVFTSPGHGLANNSVVVVTMNIPHNIGMPYSFLPIGLIMGDSTSNTGTATPYYVNVVDENHFTISLTSGGEAVALSKRSTMDISKFHFEQMPDGMELEIAELNTDACLLVVKGRVYNSFRWVRPTNIIKFDSGSGDGNRMGGMGYDTNMGVDSYGSCNLGRPGYNYTYAQVEMRAMGDQQAYQVNNEDYVTYSESSGSPSIKHSRKFYHLRLTQDLIEGVKMYGTTDGAFFNGTTVEVYTR